MRELTRFRKACWGLLVTGLGGLFMASCSEAPREPIAMLCIWEAYGWEMDSFIFDLELHEVYWINEDKRYPIVELNEGRMGFTGVRSRLQLSQLEILRDVQVTFSINRVTGELYMSGIPLPASSRNRCTAIDPAF